VLDTSGQSLAYVHGRETKADADIVHVLTMDEARRVASNIAKLPTLLGKGGWMADKTKLRFVESKEEDPGGEGLPIVVPTLQLPAKVAPLVSSLNLIAQEAEGIAVLRPVLAFWQLHRIRPRFNVERGKVAAMLQLCCDRLREPVEGASAMDNAWIQAWSTAVGASALLQLQSAFQAASEVLDRKSAYALAVFSLYFAVIAFVVTPFL